MLKNIPFIIVLFLIFSSLQVFFSLIVYWQKVGFSLDSVLQYIYVNGQVRSQASLVKILSPHLLAQSLTSFILCHLLQFSKKYQRVSVQRIIFGLCFFTFVNIFSSELIVISGDIFFFLKPLGFLGFLFFYFLSSAMIVNSFLIPFQSKTDTNL